MKRKFIAFYDALLFSIIAGVMVTLAVVLMVFGNFGNAEWRCQYWYLIVIFAVCIAVPATLMFCMQKITIDLKCDKIEIFYLVNYAKNSKDLHSNWIIYPSEITKVSVVHLSKDEKRKYTSARFLFSKYLKVELKYGQVKYVYASHYTKGQIKMITKLLSGKID